MYYGLGDLFDRAMSPGGLRIAGKPRRSIEIEDTEQDLIITLQARTAKPGIVHRQTGQMAL